MFGIHVNIFKIIFNLKTCTTNFAFEPFFLVNPFFVMYHVNFLLEWFRKLHKSSRYFHDQLIDATYNFVGVCMIYHTTHI